MNRDRTVMALRRPLRRVGVHSLSATHEPAPTVRRLLDLRVREDAARAEQERLGAAVERVTAAIEQAVLSVPDIVRTQLAEIAGVATELGLALAREVVGDLVDREITDPCDSVRRCLESVTQGADTGDLRVFLSSEDAGDVASRFAEDPALRSLAPDVEFCVDESLEHGSVRVETRSGYASYDPIETIDRVCAEVRKELAG